MEKLILFAVPGKKDNELFRKKPFLTNMESDAMYVALQAHLGAKGYRLATIDQHDLAEAEHIVFIDVIINDPRFREFRRRRNALRARATLIVIDAAVINYYQHTAAALRHFDRVLTWDPGRVDRKKFFPYRLPECFLVKDPFRIPFAERKFICMMNSNKFSLFEKELYSARKEAALFFEKTPEGIDVYGGGWNQRPSIMHAMLHASMRWRFLLRSIATFHVAPLVRFGDYLLNIKRFDPKTLKGKVHVSATEIYAHYRFAICFENAHGIPGYATEKMFNCLNARCVPIYWGDDEILRHVPRSCYIDMRDFPDYASLYAHLCSIDGKRYAEYLRSINAFLREAEHGPYGIPAFVRAFEEGVIES
jgi:hypothetical protein